MHHIKLGGYPNGDTITQSSQIDGIDTIVGLVISMSYDGTSFKRGNSPNEKFLAIQLFGVIEIIHRCRVEKIVAPRRWCVRSRIVKEALSQARAYR